MAEETPFTHILVPVDGSDASIEASRVAMRIAGTPGVRITFLYVVDSTVVDRIGGSSAMSRDRARQESERKGQRYLDYLSVQAHNRGLTSEQVIRRGIPHTEITNLASELGMDLIVIGQGGRSGPRRALIGSVAARVVESALCPVLVVKSSPTGR
jgi:nucleotide-binding universal stress UspA family protein